MLRQVMAFSSLMPPRSLCSQSSPFSPAPQDLFQPMWIAQVPRAAQDPLQLSAHARGQEQGWEVITYGELQHGQASEQRGQGDQGSQQAEEMSGARAAVVTTCARHAWVESDSPPKRRGALARRQVGMAGGVRSTCHPGLPLAGARLDLTGLDWTGLSYLDWSD